MIHLQKVLSPEQVEQRDAFVERILQSSSGVFDIFTIYIGKALRFYEEMVAHPAVNSRELAEFTGTEERYVREWLEQQTVAGILEVDDPALPAQNRCYCLPAAYAEVLVNEDSPNYVAPLAQMIAGAVRPLPALLDAFRNGGGVPYQEYGVEFREGQAAINRVTFLQDLPHSWLPAIPDVDARLQADPPARVADIGMGGGWSSIGLALAYPRVRVDGFDLDAASVELARENAIQAGLNGRLKFHVRDATDPTLAGQYDLVTAFEAVHDMSDPVGALRTMRQLAGDKGAVLVVDERVGDEFTPTGNDVEWMMYGWSVLHCLPVGLADHPSVGTGTVMRAGTLRRYAREAGFRAVEVLPIDNFFFRVYRLHK